MASVNQVIIIGNIGQEPKIISTQNDNRKVVSFSVATTERGYIKKDGTKTEDATDWHNIVLFGNLAEIGAKYLHKGSLVYIQGKLKNRSYVDKSGQKRYITKIIAESMQMLNKIATQSEPTEKAYNGFSSIDEKSQFTPTNIPLELRGKSVAEIMAQPNNYEEEIPF